MKRTLFLSLLTIPIVIGTNAQTIKQLPREQFPEHTSSNVYTVKGVRHGVSFFPKTRYSHVEYDTKAPLSFQEYHSADVLYSYMEQFAKSHPDLVDLYVVAESFEGRPILQMTLTNKKSGKATEKPAAYFEGNRHSGEVSSAESVLWLMNHLITNYGKDSKITDILDHNTIYLRPINNPDGHNLYMHTALSNRSTVRPYDDDNDGLLDEDSPEDLNKDGWITQMRYKSEKGNYTIDPRDPSKRLMKRVDEGKGDYIVISEGIDNDGDGRINEDGIGGLDLHRNYPENWRPAKENTGRGFTQSGAGEYPLSEVETRATVSFLLSNPHIYIVNSMDTRVPMHLRAPSTSAPEDRMYPEDMKYYDLFDQIGKSITGYEKAGSVYSDYGNNSPIFGHGPDFGYWYYGSVWYGDEIWDGGKITKDYNNDGVMDDLDKLIRDDQENNSLGFIKWTPFNHPTLGEVEIGGWDPKFYSQNSPSNQIERWAKNQALFNLAMIEHLPRLEWEDISVKAAKKYKTDSTDYNVTVKYRNSGKLPTAFRQADLVKIVRPDQITITFDKELTEGESPIVTVLAPTTATTPMRRASSRNAITRTNGYTPGESSSSYTFTVRVKNSENKPVTGSAKVSSTRAGVLDEKSFTIQ